MTFSSLHPVFVLCLLLRKFMPPIYIMALHSARNVSSYTRRESHYYSHFHFFKSILCEFLLTAICVEANENHRIKQRGSLYRETGWSFSVQFDDSTFSKHKDHPALYPHSTFPMSCGLGKGNYIQKPVWGRRVKGKCHSGRNILRNNQIISIKIQVIISF